MNSATTPLPADSAKPHRGTILVEDAEVIASIAHPGAQHWMKLRAPRIAARALPGSFMHVRCAPHLAMRRPMSIMRANAARGEIEILFKAHGEGTALLAATQPGAQLNLLGPIGVPFKSSGKRRPLLIGGGVGIPPMVFLAEALKRERQMSPLVIMGSEVPFPFQARPSQIMVAGIPAGVIATMPLLEDLGIACRLASGAGFPGCFEGFVTDLARRWLDAVLPAAADEIEVFACGPTPMLKAVAALCRDYGLPGQVSLEEYMACAVGGCAGCVVGIETPNGRAMKRVCVDGPVFDAASVVFQ
jgi:dihydroorotate dehydrogenase electron transfer subunit